MKATDKKILIFDFDGTLVDSMLQIIEIVNELAPKFHINKIELEKVEQLRHLSSSELLKEFKVSYWKLPFMLYQGRKRFGKCLPDIKLVSGVGGVLYELKKNKIPMGIITSNAKDNVRKFLEKNDLEVFGFVHSDNNFFGKSSRIKKIVKSNNWNKNNVFYIGDETRDVEAAKKAGVKSVAVTWGFGSKESLAKFNPDYLLDHPAEILKIL